MKQNVTPLNKESIAAAIQCGKEQAKQFADTNKYRDDLSKKFLSIVQITDRLLENFDTTRFACRENNIKPKEELDIMLLGAFEAVSYLKTLGGFVKGANVREVVIQAEKNLEEACQTYKIYKNEIYS